MLYTLFTLKVWKLTTGAKSWSNNVSSHKKWRSLSRYWWQTDAL